MVRCQICSREFTQITQTHLKKSHQLTLPEYKEKFPNAEIVSKELRDKISQANKGKERSDEHKKNLRESVRRGFENGRQAHNKGLTGVIKDSEETKEKKRQARLGKVHSEETKALIGAKHKGKIRTQEEIDKWRTSYQESLVANGGGFATGPRSEEFKARMSEIAKNRSKEQYGPKLEAMWKARRGALLTDEQKQKHREGTIKWMQMNPDRVFNTGVEIAFKTFLIEKSIEYVQQFVIDGIDHPYDFYLPAFNTLVEIDGPQHWKQAIWGTSGKTEEEKDQILQRQIEKDAYENLAAVRNGFKIIRVQVEACIETSPKGHFLEQMRIQGLTIQ